MKKSTALEEQVVAKLIEKGYHISFAESCTGGLLAATLVNVSGSSKVFQESYVTYSNEAKVKNLSVKEGTLEAFGAVSEETAIEMAQGVAKKANTEVGVSTTGVAGPTGGTKEKPVGLVYIACSIEGHVRVLKCAFKGDRQRNREDTVKAALRLLLDELIEKRFIH